MLRFEQMQKSASRSDALPAKDKGKDTDVSFPFRERESR